MKLFTILFILFSALNLSAQNNVFVKEYTYNASDDDSKNSARKKAITQLKAMVSEESGTIIKSTFKQTTHATNDRFNKSLEKELQSLSSSFTKVTILDEKWNGQSYYVKAKIVIDKKKTEELITNLQKNKNSETTKEDTYVEIIGEQAFFKRGKKVFTATNGDVFKLIKEIKCLKDDARCWIMKDTNSNRRGVVKKVVMKNFHKVFRK